MGETGMRADIYWTTERFPGRLALLARPRGGDWLEDETSAWTDAGIDVVVSMLDEVEVGEFGLAREAELSEANGIEFISFPVTDRSVPAADKNFSALTEKLRKALMAGKNVGIHCRQSIGRAPLLAATLMALFGMEPAKAFRQLSSARGREVPETPEQLEWVKNFADQLTTTHS